MSRVDRQLIQNKHKYHPLRKYTQTRFWLCVQFQNVAATPTATPTTTPLMEGSPQYGPRCSRVVVKLFKTSYNSKIINAIMEQSENPSVSSSRKLDDKQWKSYLKKCDLYGIDGKRLNVNQINIFKIPSRTAKAIVIYRILEKASINEHTYIALYCKDDFDAKQIRFHLNDFISSTDKTHDQILNYANLSLGEIKKLELILRRCSNVFYQIQKVLYFCLLM